MADGKLEGKVALVTGAGGDIGAALSALFAAEAAAVACADIRGDAADRTAAAVTAAGGRAASVACDVSDGASAEAAVRTVVGRFGALHVLVNGAAIFPPECSLLEVGADVFERAFAVNVGGAYHMSRHAIPEMVRAGGGSIIHIASQLGHVGKKGQATYCATKGALIALAKAMALDHAEDRIRVNTLSPGGIATEGMAETWGGLERAEENWGRAKHPWGRLGRVEENWGRAKHPWGRLGRVEEVARAALFLASEDSSFMTGADLLVDGGYTAI